MPNAYEEALKGSRSEVAELATRIERELSSYNKPANRDAPKQLKYALHILRYICTAAATPQGTHYDVYCDILERSLTPSVQPKANAKHWGVYLESLRFLHHLFANKKLYVEASRVYKCLVSQPDKLQNASDYKPILATYCLHLLCQRNRQLKHAELAEQEIPYVVDALTALFKDMQCSRSVQQFMYTDLMEVFVQCWCKQSTILFNFLATGLPTVKKELMYDAFFALLRDTKAPTSKSTGDVQLLTQKHLEAFVAFLQMDVSAKLQQQVCLQHLRVCCEVPSLQEADDKLPGYTFNLLYYYVKLVYAQTKFNNFKTCYMELCGKFVNFFEKSGDVLVQQQWFLDLLVAFSLLLAQTHQRAASYFENFWQQMNCIDCYAVHLELLMCCIKLASRINESKLSPWNCCKSVRKHTILSYAQSVLTAYSYFVMHTTETSEISTTNNLNKTFTSIMRYAVDVINSMSCITNTSIVASVNGTGPTLSHDFKMFYARFAQLTRDLKTPAQSLYCIGLSDILIKLQPKFPATDWTLFLRRMYKTAELSGDAALTAELHGCYIAALLQETPLLDLAQLRNQIAIFHAKPKEHCLLECLTRCKSVLKPKLEKHQKHLLHWLEMQYIFKYLRTSEKLQLSLLRQCQTFYEHVLLVRTCKIAASGAGKLNMLYESLWRAARERGGVDKMRRLELLTLGHVCTQLMHERTDVQKKILEIETKDCMEDKMDELLQRKELACINVTTERELIDLALEALHAFAGFFKKADAEHISSDEAFVDWESIVEDLAALALYFQSSGYLLYATEAWLLHYDICNTIEDHYNSLRSLSYFLEHAHSTMQKQDNSNFIDLPQEISKKTPIMLNFIENTFQLTKRQQTAVLICLSQLAYYHAGQGNFSYAQILLQLVKHKHEELPERQGKCDLVVGTLAAVRIRILWKHLDHLRACGQPYSTRAPLLQRCVVREIESALENFREFVYISASDALLFTILLFTLAQQAAECLANRLYDYHINNLFASVLKIALQSRFSLRIVQILTMWMWSNLQMEYVAKAQTKLKIIECILGVKSFQKLAEEAAVKAKEPLKKALSFVEPNDDMLLVQVLGAGVETMRKVVPLHQSPIKENKLKLSAAERNDDLKRFLHCGHHATLEKCDLLQWSYFAVGCLNARLYFLIDENEQLDDFYVHCFQWLEQRKSGMSVQHFLNFKLLCLQHYVNYLRARKQHKKACAVLKEALACCEELAHRVDSVYRLNLLLQMHATKLELASQQSKAEKSNRIQVRKALQREQSFNASIMENTLKKCKQNAATAQKTTKSAAASSSVFPSEEDATTAAACSHTKLQSRKQLFQMGSGSSSSNSSHRSSSQEDEDTSSSNKNKKPIIDLFKPTKEDDLNLCQAISSIDLVDSSSDEQNDCALVEPTPAPVPTPTMPKTRSIKETTRTTRKAPLVRQASVDVGNDRSPMANAPSATKKPQQPQPKGRTKSKQLTLANAATPTKPKPKATTVTAATAFTVDVAPRLRARRGVPKTANENDENLLPATTTAAAASSSNSAAITRRRRRP